MGPRARAGFLAVALTGILAGCSPAGSAAPSPAPSSASPTTRGPISAVVDQFRDGYASGTIVLQLANNTEGPVTVVRAELADGRFADGTAWTGSEELAPGLTVSLPAVTAAPSCGRADDGAPSVRVTLADGSVRTVAATDPHVVLPRIHADACFAERVAAVVTLRLTDALAPGGPPGTAVLTLALDAPAGAGAGAVTLVSVGNTTLLDEDPAAPWPRNVSLSAGGAPLRLTVRPARCDPHAVAEDKVGTLIPLILRLEAATAGAATGTVKVAASPTLRAEIYAFVARSCGWTASQ